MFFPKTLFEKLQLELRERFGGLTIYQRAPATGLWKEEGEHVVKDEVVIYEVIIEDFDVSYWLNSKHCEKRNFASRN